MTMKSGYTTDNGSEPQLSSMNRLNDQGMKSGFEVKGSLENLFYVIHRFPAECKLNVPTDYTKWAKEFKRSCGMLGIGFFAYMFNDGSDQESLFLVAAQLLYKHTMSPQIYATLQQYTPSEFVRHLDATYGSASPEKLGGEHRVGLLVYSNSPEPDKHKLSTSLNTTIDSVFYNRTDLTRSEFTNLLYGYIIEAYHPTWWKDIICDFNSDRPTSFVKKESQVNYRLSRPPRKRMGPFRTDICCSNCGGFSHYASECTSPKLPDHLVRLARLSR